MFSSSLSLKPSPLPIALHAWEYSIKISLALAKSSLVIDFEGSIQENGHNSNGRDGHENIRITEFHVHCHFYSVGSLI